jgi:hypothetical protein
MSGRVSAAWLWVAGTILNAQSTPGPDTVLRSISEKVKQNLDEAPNYVCLESVQRSRLLLPGGTFEPLDTLRVEVGLMGDRELYSWPGDNPFDENKIQELAATGVIGTGNFVLLARHVFLAHAAGFTWRGEENLGSRRALRFDYAVPRDSSAYRIHVPPRQAVVGFSGSIWADPATLDLLRIELRAEDIPPQLGIAKTRMVLDYGRLPGSGSFLLPLSSELNMTGLDGIESRNVAAFTACRKYESDSKIAFDPAPADRPKPMPAEAGLVAGVSFEVALADNLDLGDAVVGNPVRATLTRPIRDGESVRAPEGSVVIGRIVRLEKESQPFEHYILALELFALESGGTRIRIRATMREAVPTTGLIRKERRLDPTFTRQRQPGIKILVNEHHEGEGILEWDARHPRIPKGFRMRWQAEDPR